MKKLFVIGMAALLLVAFTMPVMAKVKVGGIIFTDFYYLNRDKDNYFNPARGVTSYHNTAIQIPNISRLYARWTNEDNVGMYIELGLGQTKSGIEGQTDDGVNLRHAYGWWDVTPAFRIMAGKSTTPFSPLNPSQLLGTRSGSVNIIGGGYGEFYSGRFVQVRGTFKFGKMGRVELALVDPNGALAAGDLHPATSGTDNTVIPRIDVGVPLYFGPVAIYPSFAYQYKSYDGAKYAGVPISDSITSWIGSLGAKAGFGGFGIAVEGQYGDNWANMRGFAGVSPAVGMNIGNAVSGRTPISGAVVDANNKINDAETWGYWIDLSYKFGVITPHFIWGQLHSENVMMGTNTDVSAKTSMIGISVPIALAKGFSIRPELMWYDDGEGDITGQLKQNFGKYSIYGVQFQIVF